MALTLVRTTVGTQVQAHELAQRLIALRMAACVHIQAVRSVYRWKGVVQDDDEFIVEARCLRQREAAVREVMLSGHPYEVPMVEAFDVRGAPAQYEEWALHETGP